MPGLPQPRPTDPAHPASPERLLSECRSLRALLATTRRQLQDLEETHQATLHGYWDTVARGTADSPPLHDQPFRRLVESLSIGVGLITPEGSLLYANHALASLLDGAAAPLARVPLDRFIAPEDQERYRLLLTHACSREVTDGFVIQTPTRFSVRAQFRFTPSPLPSERLICLTVIDLSERGS